MARRKCHSLTCAAFALLLLLVWVHFVLLPGIMQSYNNECYLSVKDKKDLDYVLSHVIESLEKHSITYWLDYGTLLGAMRNSDIIPWDGDADVSVLMPPVWVSDKFAADLKQRGIDGNIMVATMNNVQVDIMRWNEYDGRYKGVRQPMLKKYYPSWNQDHLIVKVHRELESFPKQWIEKLNNITFSTYYAKIPNNPWLLLHFRYPWTYWINFPYKWKCWI